MRQVENAGKHNTYLLIDYELNVLIFLKLAGVANDLFTVKSILFAKKHSNHVFLDHFQTTLQLDKEVEVRIGCVGKKLSLRQYLIDLAEQDYAKAHAVYQALGPSSKSLKDLRQALAAQRNSLLCFLGVQTTTGTQILDQVTEGFFSSPVISALC